MNAFQIKLIAVVTMVVDHVGLFFFPNLIVLRIIGRLSFPIFAWLIANGARYTKNIRKYLKRLLIFALVSQVPYVVAVRLVEGVGFWEFNILFTLSIGLFVVILIKEINNSYLKILNIILVLILTYYLPVDYGLMGVLSIIGFYIFFKDFNKLIIFQSIVFLGELVIATLLLYPQTVWEIVWESNYIQPLALLSLMIIYAYNEKEGRKMKYWFYWFYPMQFVVIYLVKTLF